MKNGRPTMKDVAKLAGVTQPTVSYVINGTATISEEVKERVYKAIEELDYKPNFNAVALKTKRSHVIGVILPDIVNSYYAVMAGILEKRLTKEGYMVLINSTSYKGEVEELIVKQLLSHNVEAFIIAYQFTNSECWRILGESGKEAVVIEAGKKGGMFSAVETDNFYGSYMATMHLLREGRKRIAYIGQNSNIDALWQRESGYIEALKESGSQGEPVIYRTGGPDEKWMEGVKIGGELIKQDIDGILVSSDEIAVGILKTFLSSGVKVPDDVSIIGYDDIPIAKLLIPELTTVAQPMNDICQNAADMLIKLIRGEKAASIKLKPELIVRKTTHK